jgi:hypothetical protein
MKYLSVKNWSEFQHYKDRSPPWIKLHRDLLNDYDFSCLQDASKAHLMLLWLLASQMDNKIPADQKWLKNKLSTTNDINVKELIDKGFLLMEQDASIEIAESKQSAMPETEAEAEAEAYREDREADFDVWYKLYPHKIGKADAKKSFKRAKATLEELTLGLKRYIESKPADRPWCNPATWLNQERWKDQPADAKQSFGNSYLKLSDFGGNWPEYKKYLTENGLAA